MIENIMYIFVDMDTDTILKTAFHFSNKGDEELPAKSISEFCKNNEGHHIAMFKKEIQGVFNGVEIEKF